MLYAKEFNKILVFILWVFMIISLFTSILNVYTGVQTCNILKIPYAIAFIPLFFTFVNIYAVIVLVLIEKKIFRSCCFCT